jgi:hypothetical protein
VKNPNELFPEFEAEVNSQFAEVKYSLPELLRDVKLDRSSSLFSMEKLDQDTISRLFEQHHSRRGPSSEKK